MFCTSYLLFDVILVVGGKQESILCGSCPVGLEGLSFSLLFTSTGEADIPICLPVMFSSVPFF